jgi:hypothetical protein
LNNKRETEVRYEEIIDFCIQQKKKGGGNDLMSIIPVAIGTGN